MKGWAELKEAFWAAAEGDPAERARHIAALASIDPALPSRLEALLAADDRGESLQYLFQSEPVRAAHPARIGGYDVLGVLGAGGMGEVYRARDVRLQREVAIKVLPAEVITNHDRLARFQREAQMLASLNHPNIAQVYGLDESGGMPALVMELVPGPTLATVIAGYPDASLTVSRALMIARQIADGLDAAHEKGIIHRDLKPSNVALTQEGEVKILDFGVAKSFDTGKPNATGASAATDIGVVFGTPAYMSPEQARGLTVDKRTDIWAFGCLLYELLTGRQAFAGNTASDTLAAVLERNPDMVILPAATPAAVRSLLRHCLEKDPKRRLRDIADARLELDEAERELASPAAATSPPRRHERFTSLATGIGLTLLAVAAAAWLLRNPAPIETLAYRSSIVLPAGTRFASAEVRENPAGRFVLSPDGRALAFLAARDDGPSMIWVRRLDTGIAQPLEGTEGGSFPFWSPDSRFLAFHAAGKLKRIEASGGSPLTLCDAVPRGSGTWNRDDVILFAPAVSSPIYRVSASGGTPSPVTRLDPNLGDAAHSYPFFLPDGQHFLYFAVGSKTVGLTDPRAIYVGSLDPNEPSRLLLEGGSNAKYAQGQLLFLRGNTLMAQGFNPSRLELTGEVMPLAEQIQVAEDVGTAGAFTVSENGVLAYQTGLDVVRSELAWFDRGGKQLAVLGDRADYTDLALSPDGRHVAVSILDAARRTRDLWVYDVERAVRTRITFDQVDEIAPSWSSDGSRLLFAASRNGRYDLYEKPSTGTGAEDVLLADTLGKYSTTSSADGRFVLYVAGGGIVGRSDLWVFPQFGDRKPTPFLESSFIETHGQFSPDGRWVAYTSSESGRREVYVTPFPGRGGKWRVSTAGGGWPRWRRDGKEIFYLDADNMLSATVVSGDTSTFQVGTVESLFALHLRPWVRLDSYSYDVSRDGRRLLVNTFVEEPTSPVTLVVNWTALLEK